MHRIALFGALALALCSVGVVRMVDLESRVSELAERKVTPRQIASLEAEFSSLAEQIVDLQALLHEVDAKGSESSHGMRAQLRELQVALAAAAERLAAQGSELANMAKAVSTEDVERRLREAQDGTEERFEGLSEVVARTASVVARTQEEVAQIEEDLDRDVDRMWSELVGPTVQLAGETTVGSGVLLQSRRLEDSDDYETLIVTAWHVVRDILADAGGNEAPVPTTIYSADGSTWLESAKLLHYNVDLDVALLRLETDQNLEHGAELATTERMQEMKIFEDIYAVGCPLGNDPIPTRGEIADTRHRVDGKTYWMLSAPTYIGNSGGGIFDAKSHQLIGVFSKIYTHGNLRPTVVPHMGLATPMHQVYEWIEKEKLGRLVANEGHGPTLILAD